MIRSRRVYYLSETKFIYLPVGLKVIMTTRQKGITNIIIFGKCTDDR